MTGWKRKTVAVFWSDTPNTLAGKHHGFSLIIANEDAKSSQRIQDAKSFWQWQNSAYNTNTMECAKTMSQLPWPWVIDRVGCSGPYERARIVMFPWSLPGFPQFQFEKSASLKFASSLRAWTWNRFELSWLDLIWAGKSGSEATIKMQNVPKQSHSLEVRQALHEVKQKLVNFFWTYTYMGLQCSRRGPSEGERLNELNWALSRPRIWRLFGNHKRLHGCCILSWKADEIAQAKRSLRWGKCGDSTHE